MTLAEAIAAFTERSSPDGPPSPGTKAEKASLGLLETYLAGQGVKIPGDITAFLLRDFLSRWYISEPVAPVSVPRPGDLLDSLSRFLAWVDGQTGSRLESVGLPIIREMDESLPRALKITEALSNSISRRGGPFSFPEFLTSFEEGGRSQFDLDAPGEVGALEGYFQIIRVEGSLCEAIDTISQERVWPIVFPDEVARLISPGYVMNLEIIRSRDGWHITGCGLTYPPNSSP